MNTHLLIVHHGHLAIIHLEINHCFKYMCFFINYLDTKKLSGGTTEESEHLTGGAESEDDAESLVL